MLTRSCLLWTPLLTTPHILTHLTVSVVLQTSARRNGIPIDSLVFEHGIVNLEEREIGGPPKEGVYVKGLFLEGGCVMHRAPASCSSRHSYCSIPLRQWQQSRRATCLPVSCGSAGLCKHARL